MLQRQHILALAIDGTADSITTRDEMLAKCTIETSSTSKYVRVKVTSIPLVRANRTRSAVERLAVLRICADRGEFMGADTVPVCIGTDEDLLRY